MNTSEFESGVDSSYSQPVPVDRQTYLANYHRGPDHPTYFAKGSYENDNTVGGQLCQFINNLSFNHSLSLGII